MLKIVKTASVLLLVGTLSSCGGIGGGGIGQDRGFDSKSLSSLQAGIWVDPNGCHHWIIDDGIEGYLSTRFGPNGLPYCDDTSPRSEASGNFKGGGSSLIGDPI